jgi:aryl-alcohol dehydrogenase-like predicted oxidoreductase
MIDRREFIRRAVAAGILTSAAGGRVIADSSKGCKSDKRQFRSMPRRMLGSTGQKLSIIGFGGIVVMNAEQEHANKVVAEAVEKGINYFDVAPTYGDAEVKLGPALEPFRKDCFLACKTTQRSKEGAKKELDESLKRLKTDYLDLYQLHAITDVEKDVKSSLADDGAIQTFLEAKKAGVVRYLGFSAHSPEAAIYAMENFDFDTILYPINFATHYQEEFDQAVVELAERKGMGILALKAMAKQVWPEGHVERKNYSKCWYEPTIDLALARLALYWTLSQPVTAAIPPGDESLWRRATDIGPGFGELCEEDKARLDYLANDLSPIFRTG